MDDVGRSAGEQQVRAERRILLLCNGTEQQTTGRLFTEMAKRLSGRYEVYLQLRSFPQGLLRKVKPLLTTEVRNCRRIISSDIIIVHSALSLSLLSMIWAKLLRRRIIAFIWDFYPASTRVAGNIKNPILLWIYGVTEAFAYRLADAIYVPTDDYADFPALNGYRNVRRLPLWSCDSLRSPQADVPTPGAVHLAFAGQINAIRGLDKVIATILSRDVGKIVLHLFSKDDAPEPLALLAAADKNLEIRHHGFVEPSTLQDMLGGMDFGLIPIDKNFQLPAFPSKALAYLAAGLPIVYDGPPMPGLESVLRAHEIGMTLSRFSRMDGTELKVWRTGFLERRDQYIASIDQEWQSFAENL